MINIDLLLSDINLMPYCIILPLYDIIIYLVNHYGKSLHTYSKAKMYTKATLDEIQAYNGYIQVEMLKKLHNWTLWYHTQAHLCPFLFLLSRIL